MENITRRAPYHDDYDPSKDYTTLLAVPGYAEQAREFTQIQTTLYDYLGRLGESVLSNGSIIDGCSVIIQNTKVIINPGKIFYQGLVRNIKGATFNIQQVGSEVIGVKLESSIVTELEDPTLRDPAQGYENYNQPGAHRIRETLIFTQNDEESTTVFRIENGDLVRTEEVPELDKVLDILARRTYDESGNYKIRGLELRDRNEVRQNKLAISLTEGKAYIQGYEVLKPAVTTILIDKSLEYREVINEPKIYNSSNPNKYILNNQPVKTVNQLSALVEVNEKVTRGNIQGGIDYLSKTPVSSVVSVVQGSTTFVNGTDFQLVNDGIDWSLPGQDPSIGSTYTVIYRYNKVMIEDSDFSLKKDSAGLDYVQFLNKDKPIQDSTFNITYDFYLSRRDLVTLDKDGNSHVTRGHSDVGRLVETPLNQNNDRLIIGSVLIEPNSDKVKLANVNTTRLSMNDLFKLNERIEDMEYNQAITDLDREAIDGESATDLKGVFTDGFIGLTKSDLTHPDYDCTIDLDMQELTLPSTITIESMKPDVNASANNIGVIGKVITAPFHHKLALSQSSATGTMLVNPYAVFNPMSLVQLVPDVDNWVETERTTVREEKTVATTLRRWWYHRGASWAEDERRKWMQLGFADGGEGLGWAAGKGVTTDVSTDIVLDEAILYMREREVEVIAQNFVPGANNVECYFNEIKVPLTPLAGHQAGTQAGTMRADTKGKFKAKFTVPPNIPCGSVEVLLKAIHSQGDAIYRAQGRRQVIEETVLTTTVNVRPTDPLAQSFGFERDTVMTKLDLYFASKDDNKAVSVEVRNMVNGYPGNIVYASAIVDADDVKISDKGTVATTVEFDQPVYCKQNTQYCFAVLSDSDDYSMFIATLGEKDLRTDQFVTSQPYEVGVLFSSSNAQTWTAHQRSDLKFDLYKAEYTGVGTVIFTDVTDMEITRVLVAAQVLDHKDAGIEWSFKADKGPWLPIETYVDRELPSITKKISLRAELKIAHSTSPIMSKEVINLIGFIEKTNGTYVSKNVNIDRPFENIKVIMDLALPTGTTCEVYYQSIDIGLGWTRMTNPTITPISTEFARYEWEDTATKAINNYRVKVVLTTNNRFIKPRARKLMNILK